MAEIKRNSWAGVADRFNGMYANYADLPMGNLYAAMARAGMIMFNQPQIQNARIKSISSLPLDYSKEDIGEFLRAPYTHEKELRSTAEVLKWTTYPLRKIIKTYSDIPTYRHITKPLYLDAEAVKKKEFMREAILLDKLSRTMKPESMAHEAAGKALTMGKVAYVPRYDVDKAHNKINFAFWQQLPEDYVTIIGQNNVSGWTVSFNMMYFMKPGTSPKSFGDLFDFALDGFDRMFRPREKVAYAAKVKSGNKMLNFYPENINPQGEGSPKTFEQNGRWSYWVSLPVEKVWVFEADDTSPAMASPLSGMFLTYAQQGDFEAIQRELLTNPLLKIFTGEIPYFDNTANAEDQLKLSIGMKDYFVQMFADLMTANNTAGAAMYLAPAENIKSHDYAESANANDISTTFNHYAVAKSGLAALIPVDDDIKAGQVEASCAIENRYITATIYPQFERMMNYIYKTLNLSYEWEFHMFGTIFDEKDRRENAQKDLDRGDITAFMTLAALDGGSWLDKVSSLHMMGESGIMDLLKIPATAYTQSAGGRPPTDEMSESKEKSVDAGASKQ